MKNLFTAFILGIALMGISFAQGTAARGAAPKIAVVEFSPGPNASGMTDQAKRSLHTALSASLNHTRKFDVYDTRHTRNASQGDLAAINGTSSAAAVKVGKQLGVAFVLTGAVTEYNTGGSATAKFRLVEVATGKVRHSGEIAQVATIKMTGNAGAAEMQAKVMKPLIEKLTNSMASAF
jgi:curli biogenesis system outer membrane secretion channel CsgG